MAVARSFVGALLASLCCAPGAAARAYQPPGNHVFAGLTGGTTIAPFQRMVGKHPPVFEIYMTWDTPTDWLAPPDGSFRARLALHISTSPGYARPGVISPRGIALGRSDGFLVGLSRHLARSGRIVYVRVMGEMNGYWNAYSPFSADGTFRGEQNSPYNFVRAWRRSVLILRGGRVRRINSRLRRLGMPPLKMKAKSLPRPRVAFLWVPQDAGSPDISADAPAAFWPGGEYVDWVGTDFYASYPNFPLLDQFYSEFTGKPFVLSEWALYGRDEPSFVQELFAWVRSHPRVRMLNYFQGFRASGPSNLGHYPASRRALRRELKSPRFLAYASEYAHPMSKKHEHRRRPPKQPPERPPLPPTPGPQPGPPQLCVPLLQICIPGL
jgi:hypothetical protein